MEEHQGLFGGDEHYLGARLLTTDYLEKLFVLLLLGENSVSGHEKEGWRKRKRWPREETEQEEGDGVPQISLTVVTVLLIRLLLFLARKNREWSQQK
jgi:hypothetical protein